MIRTNKISVEFLPAMFMSLQGKPSCLTQLK